MKVSIVTPVYNEPRLQHALDSVVEQRFPGSPEVIVVDGMSTDGTVDVIERYRREIDVLIREPDDGLYDAMNKGIGRASGDIVAVLNADDRYRDEHVLRDVLRRFTETGSDVVYGDLVMVSGDRQVVRDWRAGTFDRSKIRRGWFPPHPSFFVRREVYEMYGTFDTSYRLAADIEFMLRVLWREGVEASYLSRTLVEMAVGGKSTRGLSSIMEGNFEVSRACRKHGLGLGIVVPLLKPVRKVGQFFGRGGTGADDDYRVAD